MTKLFDGVMWYPVIRILVLQIMKSIILVKILMNFINFPKACSRTLASKIIFFWGSYPIISFKCPFHTLLIHFILLGLHLPTDLHLIPRVARHPFTDFLDPAPLEKFAIDWHWICISGQWRGIFFCGGRGGCWVYKRLVFV